MDAPPVRYRPAADPLFRAIIGEVILMGALILGLYLYWGSGTVLVQVPIFVPLINGFLALIGLAVAFLALGRYMALGDSASFWVGLGFLCYGVGNGFVVPAFPGTAPGGQPLIAVLPNTSAWIVGFSLTLPGLFFIVASLVAWPGREAMPGRRFAWLVLGATLCFVLLFALLLALETYLPPIVTATGAYTSFFVAWSSFLVLEFALASLLTTRRYLQSGDTLFGYISLTLVAIAFGMLATVLSTRRFDLWFYLARSLHVVGDLTMMFGLLSEFVRLFRRERERTTELLGVLKASADAIFVTDARGGVGLANRKALELLRVSSLDEISHPVVQWASPYEVRDREGQRLSEEELPLARVGRGESLQNEEFQFLDLKTGSVVWLLASGGPLLDESGKRTGGILTGTDITERKRAEAAVRESEERFKTLFDVLPVGVSILAPDRRTVDVNPSLESILGLSREELLSGEFTERRYLKPDGTPMGPEDFPTVRAFREQRLVGPNEIGVVKEDGTTNWVEVSATPFPVQGLGVAAITTDITGRKEAEAALRQSEERFRAVFQYSAIGIVIGDMEGRVVESNQAFQKLLGYSEGELRGMAFTQFTHPDDVAIEWPLVEELIAGRRDYYEIEKRYIRKDGETIHIRLVGSGVRGPTGEPLFGVALIEDITERKRAEAERERLLAEVQRSELHYRSLFESMGQGFALMRVLRDSQGQVVDLVWQEVNPAFEGISGTPTQALIGRTLSESSPKTVSYWLPIASEVTSTGVPIRRERFTEAIGKWLETYCYSPAENLMAFLFTDITEQKEGEAHRERLLSAEQEARERAERTARLRDEFLFVAAHELKTPVTSLRGFSQTVIRRFEKSGTLDHDLVIHVLNRIDQQTRRLTALTEELLDVSRLEVGKLSLKPEDVDLSTIIQTAIDAMRVTYPLRDFRFLKGSATRVTLDPLRIEQVITNLLENAVKFSPSEAPVEIGLALQGSEAVISVRDHGRGVPEGDRERIFERFYQAHEERHYGGLGLGLYISSQIVQMHGGTITCEAPEGKGSLFVIRLPLGRGKELKN